MIRTVHDVRSAANGATHDKTTHPDVTAESLEAAREYNFKCYHFQVIGRYTDM